MADTNVAKTPVKSGKIEKPKLRWYQSFWKYVLDSKDETFKKCTWPDREELTRLTSVVIFALVAVGGWMWLINTVLSLVTSNLPGGGQ